MAFLFRELKPVAHIETPFEDRSAKYLVMRRLAVEVERCDADVVMLVGELWSGKANPKEPFLYPSDMPDRTEHLALNVCAKDGDLFHLISEIKRAGKKVSLAETIEGETPVSWMFAPIQEYWRKK